MKLTLSWLKDHLDTEASLDTVAETLTLGRQPRRWGLVSPRAMRARAREMLGGYGLDVDVDRTLGAYSVAVQQIVAIARAVALSGRVLILDEPTASLDAREVGAVRFFDDEAAVAPDARRRECPDGGLEDRRGQGQIGDQRPVFGF